MKEDIKKPEASDRLTDTSEWLSKTKDVTVRDDQYDYLWLLDSVKLCRKRRIRFRLVDMGTLDCDQIERLLVQGAELYTSDETGRKAVELEFIQKAAKKRRGLIAYFQHGALETEEKKDFLSFYDLIKLGRAGIYFHLSNRERKRDVNLLCQLAYECRKGKSWLVYYHHGPMEYSLTELGKNGAWIYMSDRSIQETTDTSLLLEIIKSARSSETNVVFYLENKLGYYDLSDIIQAGAFVLFKHSLIDYKSPFKDLERESRRKKLNPRSYYLYPTFHL